MDLKEFNKNLLILYNQKVTWDYEISGLVTKLYKRMKKSLHKFNTDEIGPCEFHDDVAKSTAGLIGYLLAAVKEDPHKQWHAYAFESVYKKTGLVKSPYSIDETHYDRDLIFDSLRNLLLDDSFTTNECGEIFVSLKYLYFQRRNKNRGLSRLTYAELLCMKKIYEIEFNNSYWMDAIFGAYSY